MKHVLGAMIILSSVGFQSQSFSEEAAKKLQYKKHTQMDFEAKNVDGQFLKPEGRDIQGEKNVDFDSLLGPRKNFKKELAHDARSVR